MECKYCQKNENALIKGYENWNVLIHSNQYYLGRCKVVLKRHIEDLTEIENNEREELFLILKNLRKIINESFGANLINYTSAGNITQHLHIHFIPRYNHEVEFENHTFKDEFWGGNHSFYPRDLKTDKDLLNKIKLKIKEGLK